MIPPLFNTRLTEILGVDYDRVMDAFAQERIGSFRINSLHGDGSDIWKEFAEKNISVTPYHFGKPQQGLEIYTFDRSYEFAIKGTRAFYDGKIYLQSLASLLPVLVLDPQCDQAVLDVCAAPGSKTTQISMLMKNTGSVVAIEQNQIRYDKLVHNCRLQGATNVECIKKDARAFLQSTDMMFDAILLDAPCSAEGRIALQNEKTYGFWSLENIEKKAELQSELLSLALSRLRQGGSIVYSTCTLAPEENEGVIARILDQYPDMIVESIDGEFSHQDWSRPGMRDWQGKIYGDALTHTLRILPSIETEGFFLTKLTKK